MKKYFISLLLFFYSSNLLARNPILGISIPKCGTHLLSRCLYLLTKKSIHGLEGQPLTQEDFEFPGDIYLSHLVYGEKVHRDLDIKNFIKFFIYRDPRDQVVSLTFFSQSSVSGYDKYIFPRLNICIKDVDFNTLLLDFIIDGSWLYSSWLYGDCNINNYYRLFLPWKDISTVYTIRFEDLIGPLGGGTESAQFREIKNIAHHLGIAITEDTVKEVAKNLFGNTWTFREGKIGSWKQHFTVEHKKAFKQIAGQLLIDLGYEKDLSW